jgi:WD40 repeat protein
VNAADSQRLGDLRGVEQASFNHDGSRVIVRMRGGSVGIWAVPGGERIAGDLEEQPTSDSHVMSADARMVLIGFKDGHSRVFEAASAKAVSPILDVPLRGQMQVSALFSPDNNVLVIFAEKEVVVLNVRSGERIATIPLAPGTNEDSVGSAAFTAGGAQCFLMDGSGAVTRYDTKDWKPIGKPMRHPAAELAYEFFFNASEDGKWLVTFDSAGENGPKGQLQVWDAVAGKPLGKPLAAVNGFVGRFLGTNRIVITPFRGEATVRDLPSMKVAYSLRPHDELDGPKVEISPDQKWIVSWGPDRRLDSFDAASGKLANNHISSAAISKVMAAPDSSSCFVIFDNTAFLLEGHHDYYVMKMSLPELNITASLRILDYLLSASLSQDGKCVMIQQGTTDQERLLFFHAATLKPLE